MALTADVQTLTADEIVELAKRHITGSSLVGTRPIAHSWHSFFTNPLHWLDQR